MKAIAEKCNVFASDDIEKDLREVLKSYDATQVFLLTDKGSEKNCRKGIDCLETIDDRHRICIDNGDDAKDYTSAIRIWQALSDGGATRKAVLINLGGGMPCDLGGFCASTFKRGISFINIPTTLLSQVDASLGGKTGMNLGQLKNEIGTFRMANKVLISSKFLRTLDKENLLSGFAEMIKHGLIYKGEIVDKLLDFDFENIDYDKLQALVEESIQIKEHFVLADPEEKGLRKALNFGHTFGHAFETLSMRRHRPILHGYAVAYGMVCELLLSAEQMGLDKQRATAIGQKLLRMYGTYEMPEGSEATLLELMGHDKKNDGHGINFTLLPEVGRVEVNQIGSPTEISKILADFGKMQKA